MYSEYMNPNNDKSMYCYTPFGHKVIYHFPIKWCNCEMWMKRPIKLRAQCTCGRLDLCDYCIINRPGLDWECLHG